MCNVAGIATTYHNGLVQGLDQTILREQIRIEQPLFSSLRYIRQAWFVCNTGRQANELLDRFRNSSLASARCQVQALGNQRSNVRFGLCQLFQVTALHSTHARTHTHGRC
jgi:hypothetical protein